MLDTNIRHKISGISIADYIKESPIELARDAVGFWEIVRAGRYGFALSGNDLSEFAQNCIIQLIDFGAIPLIASCANGWTQATKYGEDSKSIGINVVSEWIMLGTDPTPDDSVWFGLKEMIAT